MKIHEKICVVCGRKFTTINGRRICCSDDCSRERGLQVQREQRKKPTKICYCKNCGEPFETSRAKKYCSISCRDMAARIRDRASQRPHKKQVEKVWEPTVKECCPEDCAHRGSMGATPCCDHLLDTGEPRPKVGGTVLECEAYTANGKPRRGWKPKRLHVQK